MQGAPPAGGHLPNALQGSQPGTVQRAGTAASAWPPAASGVPANSGHPVQPDQQRGQFAFPSVSADLRQASTPGFLHNSLLAAAPPPSPAPLSTFVPGSQPPGAAAAQQRPAARRLTKKRRPNMGVALNKAIATCAPRAGLLPLLPAAAAHLAGAALRLRACAAGLCGAHARPQQAAAVGRLRGACQGGVPRRPRGTGADRRGHEKEEEQPAAPVPQRKGRAQPRRCAPPRALPRVVPCSAAWRCCAWRDLLQGS